VLFVHQFNSCGNETQLVSVFVQLVKQTKLLTGFGERDDCCLLMIYTHGGPKNWDYS